MRQPGAAERAEQDLAASDSELWVVRRGSGGGSRARSRRMVAYSFGAAGVGWWLVRAGSRLGRTSAALLCDTTGAGCAALLTTPGLRYVTYSAWIIFEGVSHNLSCAMAAPVHHDVSALVHGQLS